LASAPKLEIDKKTWNRVRSVVTAAFRTSFHCSIGTVDADGTPYVTPIGSVLLGEPGQALYFQIFTTATPRNLSHDARICILAVNSGLGLWLRAFVRGHFSRPPGVQLIGHVVGPARVPTDAERARWQRRVRWLRWTPGYAVLWKRRESVRDIRVDDVQWIRLGTMTR